MTTISTITRSGPADGWIRWLLKETSRVVTFWNRRETIKTLQELDDHQLRDIGLMRHQIESAVNGVADPDIARFR